MRRREVIACKLSPTQARVRQACWRGVRQQVEIVERTRLPGAFRITFRGPQSALESIERLVASERRCCGWVDWRLHILGDGAALEVRAPEELLEPLAHAFGIPAIEPALGNGCGQV